jgi:hypothetical protein
MPNAIPTLGSFLNSSQYNTNLTSGDPLVAAIVAGSTFNLPAFSSGAVDGLNSAEKDPGGLFGWLIYARNYKSTPILGSTGDSYLVYSDPGSFVGDLNKLSGVTNALVSFTGSGGTWGLFQQTNNTTITTRGTQGNDFLHCIHYLAYGGRLIITGTTSGLDTYENLNNTSIEVLIGNTANSALARYIENKPSMIGIFPSANAGNSLIADNFATYFANPTNINFTAGATVADRIFNIYGINGTTYSTTTLSTGTELNYQIPAVADVAGAFNAAKNLDEIFLTVGGLDRSTVLNRGIINSINWTDGVRATLRSNRVNFYVNYTPKFLGSDLVGATGSASEVTVSERFGAAYLKRILTQQITNIGIKYLFELNIQATRDSVISEVNSVLDQYSYAMVRSTAQVICNTSNNTDYATTLNIDLIIQPLLGVDQFVINITLTS